MGIVVEVIAKGVACEEESMVMLAVLACCMLLDGNVDEAASSRSNAIGSDAKTKLKVEENCDAL